MSFTLYDLAGTFLIGFSIGGMVMWYHFYRNRLIRSREEWKRAMENEV